MSGTSVYLSCLFLLVFVRIRKHRKRVQSTRIRETIQKERELVTNNIKKSLENSQLATHTTEFLAGTNETTDLSRQNYENYRDH